MSKIALYFVMLLLLLAACIVWGIVRKFRGGTFLPPPDTIDGEEPAPRTLEEMHKHRKASRLK
jgi:hypothetical protein